MAGKLGATLFALIFALPFGGAGAYSAVGLVTMLAGTWRSHDWALVPAKVEAAELTKVGKRSSLATGTYRYSVGGREYVGTRLRFELGGGDNIGRGHQEMAEFLQAAKASGEPITIHVNPDDPADAVVTRDLRWPMVAFSSAFAVIGLAIGFFGMRAAVAAWRGKAWGPRRTSLEDQIADLERASIAAGRNPAAIESSTRSEAAFFWKFGALWSFVAIAITLLVVPDLYRQGDWRGFAVLLLPLIGLLILAGGASRSIGRLRRGRGTLALADTSPRIGGPLAGSIHYGRGGSGHEFDVRLVGTQDRREEGRDATASSQWSKDLTARSDVDPQGGMRIPFRFETPANASATWRWSVDVRAHGAPSILDAFRIVMLPSRESREDSRPARAGSLAAQSSENHATAEKLVGADFAALLGPAQKAYLARLSPDAQARVGKIGAHGRSIRVALGVLVLLLVLGVVGNGIYKIVAAVRVD